MERTHTYPAADVADGASHALDETAATPAAFESLCEALRRALEPARAHAISLHDAAGDLLWLTESSMGPDEHNAVLEALDAFAAPGGPSTFGFDLGDSRCAVLLRAVNAQRALVGAVMLVMDARVVKRDAQGEITLSTPRLRQAVADFAATRPAPEPAVSIESTAMRLSALARRPQPAVPPEVDRLHAAMRRTPIALHVQRLVPLHGTADADCYEVLLRSRSGDAPNFAPQVMLRAAVRHGLGSMIDRRVVTELIGWLVRHPTVRARGGMFSVNLTATALHDEHFIKFVELCLLKSSLPRSIVAFEVDVPTALQLPERFGAMADALHRLGCPLVLDDFDAGGEAATLASRSGVRYVKIASGLTGGPADEPRAAPLRGIVALAQRLGIRTVAKRTETAQQQEWLTTLGLDYIQSHALSPPAAIESLDTGGASTDPPPG